MIKCTCGANNADNTRFCHKCGRPIKPLNTGMPQQPYSQTAPPQYSPQVAPNPSQQMQTRRPYAICPRCQLAIYKNVNSCPRCNTLLYQQFAAQPKKKSIIRCILAYLAIAVGFIALLGVIIYVIAICAVDMDGMNSSTDYTHISEESTNNNTTMQNATIEETTIFDKNDILIKITNLDNATLSFYIENNSSLNLEFCMNSYAVNGIMANNNIYDIGCNVSANSKSNCSLDMSDVLNKNDIDTIKYLDLYIWAYDTDKSYKEFDTGIITVQTSAYDNTQYSYSGDTLLQENGITYELIDHSDNKYYIGIKNSNSELYEFDVKNVVVNDWSYDTTYAFDLIDLCVLPNCQNVLCIEIDSDFLSNSNITSIDYVEFNFDVRPNGDYFQESSSSKIRIE